MARILDDRAIQDAMGWSSLRGFDDLLRTLESSDPMDRWEGLREMGQYISVRSIDPLLSGVQRGRNPLIQQAAFDSLMGVLKALPGQVAEYEVATRLRSLNAKAGGPEIHLAIATLLDVTGCALTSRRRATRRRLIQAHSDPWILHRWVSIREDRGQMFSAAVAARQLALWAQGLSEGIDPGAEGYPLVSARLLCAARGEARVSRRRPWPRQGTRRRSFLRTLTNSRKRPRKRRAPPTRKLGDAELLVQTHESTARKCDDASVSKRLEQAQRRRLQSLMSVRKRFPAKAVDLLHWVEAHDPAARSKARRPQSV